MDKISKKNKNQIKISFVDEPAALDVTGSMVYIETESHKILVDAGLHQTNNMYNDFLVNNRRFKEFKSKEIDYIFITHNHIDHIGLIPKLYREGCKATIITSNGSVGIMKKMLLDCAYINQKDVLKINSQNNKDYKPIFDDDDVFTALKYVKDFSMNDLHIIDESLSFQLVPSGHLPKSCQILLFFNNKGIKKSILVTGDIGNDKVNNYFVENRINVKKADLVIGESTYGDRPSVKVGQKERNNDIEKLSSIITRQVCEMKGKLIIPSFAQHRLQVLCAFIYKILQGIEFPYNVYVDTPLGVDIFKEYKDVLSEEDTELLNNVLALDNLKFVKSSDDSKILVSSDEPCIILSASGMCQTGRIRYHLKKNISNPNATILFVGFSTDGSLASILKNKRKKTVTIDQKKYVCKCSVYNLKSLSGHAPFCRLLHYYSSINTNKIVLHHGSNKAKITLKKSLEKELSNKCKSTRVICANNSLTIFL